MSFVLFCKSVHGYNHQLNDMPCEDYGLINESDKGKIFAVADGHGDSRCIRSKEGSKIACEVAKKELSLFVEKVVFDGGIKYEFLKENLIKPICEGWKQSVIEDWESHPFTEAEFEKTEQWRDSLEQGIGIEHVYGSTLIAGFINEDYLLLIQQGDGHCDVFDLEGKASQPIPWDDRCLGSTTTSLCEPDACESFRIHVIDLKENKISACILGTDGVEDSYRFMEQLHLFYQKLMLRSIELSFCEFEEELEQQLSQLTREGSGDDITVSGVLDLDAIQSCSESIKQEIAIIEKYVTNKNILRSAEDKINSMTRKRNFLEQQFLRIQEEVKTLEKEFEGQEDVIELEAAREKMRIMAEEYLPYQRRYDEQQKLYHEALAELKNING